MGALITHGSWSNGGVYWWITQTFHMSSSDRLAVDILRSAMSAFTQYFFCVFTASEMGIRLIDGGECQRALEQRAAICQPSELATPPAAVAKRPTKQDMHAASDVCGHTALQSPENPGAETMRIKLKDAA